MEALDHEVATRIDQVPIVTAGEVRLSGFPEKGIVVEPENPDANMDPKPIEPQGPIVTKAIDPRAIIHSSATINDNNEDLCGGNDPKDLVVTNNQPANRSISPILSNEGLEGAESGGNGDDALPRNLVEVGSDNLVEASPQLTLVETDVGVTAPSEGSMI